MVSLLTKSLEASNILLHFFPTHYVFNSNFFEDDLAVKTVDADELSWPFLL